MQIVIRGAGGYYDPADHFGLAQFTAANMREGTATSPRRRSRSNSRRIAATVNVNAGMSSEDATLNASSLARALRHRCSTWPPTCCSTPTFPDEELNRTRRRRARS